MKHLITTFAVGVSAALAALGAAAPAGAGGQAGYGCPPTFQGVNLDQYLSLPRVYEGLLAGAFTRESRISAFYATDNPNHDGVICVKDVAAQVGSGATPIWQYYYDIVDNDASVATG